MKEILVDLSAAGEGYTGIGHDNRLIFSMLCENPDLVLSALVYPIGRPVIPRLTKHADDISARIAAIIHGMAISWGEQPTNGFLEEASRFIGELKGALRTNHRLEQVPDWMKTDALWRILFQRSLIPTNRKQVLSYDYYVSDTGYFQMHDRMAHFSWLPYKALDARGFDAVLFPYPRPLRLPSGVKRIVRYHDAIPMTHPDTVVHWIDIMRHYRYTNMVAQDGVFVCNSPMSLDDLDNVAPGAGERAAVIPCAVQSRLATKQRRSVTDILARHFSLKTLGSGENSGENSSLRDAIAQSIRAPGSFRYVISVSALEPRKNFVNSIAAWEALRSRTEKDIKFVIIGSSGWKKDITYTAMRPHVAAGNIIHVENVGLAELQALYEGAECCVFPSYAEGFGFAPLEALQMGTPSVVSTLPVFRWTLGETALYADPYNAGDIADKLELLLDVPENKARRETMKQHARLILERFSVDTVARQWRAFFQDEVDGLFEKPVKIGRRR